MSSVRKKDQSEHRFTTLDIILDMYSHTCTVISNPKFNECPDIKHRIEHEAAMIYHLCRAANEDYDNRIIDEAKVRIKLEAEAVEHCMWLKTNLRLAQKLLHIRAKKIIFWNGLVNNAMVAIKKYNLLHGLNVWYESLWEGEKPDELSEDREEKNDVA